MYEELQLPWRVVKILCLWILVALVLVMREKRDDVSERVLGESKKYMLWEERTCNRSDGTLGFGLFRFGYEEMEWEKSQKTDL